MHGTRLYKATVLPANLNVGISQCILELVDSLLVLLERNLLNFQSLGMTTDNLLSTSQFIMFFLNSFIGYLKLFLHLCAVTSHM